MSDDALLVTRRRIVVISMVTWLPLLLLSVPEGRVLDRVAVPFLLEAEVHLRFPRSGPLVVAPEFLLQELTMMPLEGLLRRLFGMAQIGAAFRTSD